MNNYQTEHIKNTAKFNWLQALLCILILGGCSVIMFAVIIVSSLYEPIRLISESIYRNWD